MAAPEKIFETYYSYALSSDMRVSFDYQFITNPAYNTDRGQVKRSLDASMAGSRTR